MYCVFLKCSVAAKDPLRDDKVLFEIAHSLDGRRFLILYSFALCYFAQGFFEVIVWQNYGRKYRKI